MYYFKHYSHGLLGILRKVLLGDPTGSPFLFLPQILPFAAVFAHWPLLHGFSFLRGAAIPA
jgi:hypothetical protein